MARRRKFVICIHNDDYPAMLEVGKVYQQLSDARAEAHKLVCVIDEDDDAALYPAGYFLPIELSDRIADALESAGALQMQR